MSVFGADSTSVSGYLGGAPSHAFPAMSLTVSSEDNGLVVVVRGEVDLHSTPQLEETLFKLIDETAEPTIDLELSELSFVDSTGLGVFVAALKRARARGGTVRLRNVPRRVYKVMEMTGLVTAFELVAAEHD